MASLHTFASFLLLVVSASGVHIRDDTASDVAQDKHDDKAHKSATGQLVTLAAQQVPSFQGLVLGVFPLNDGFIGKVVSGLLGLGYHTEIFHRGRWCTFGSDQGANCQTDSGPHETVSYASQAYELLGLQGNPVCPGMDIDMVSRHLFMTGFQAQNYQMTSFNCNDFIEAVVQEMSGRTFQLPNDLTNYQMFLGNANSRQGQGQVIPGKCAGGMSPAMGQPAMMGVPQMMGGQPMMGGPMMGRPMMYARGESSEVSADVASPEVGSAHMTFSDPAAAQVTAEDFDP